MKHDEASRAAYLPPELPAPTPKDEDAPFWARCNERQLAFQRCTRCEALTHPPLPACPACGSFDRGWAAAPEHARVFSFTWAHTASHETVSASLPYNVALVEFPALPGVLLVSNVVDATPQTLRIGADLQLAWEQGWNGQWVPRFRLLGAGVPASIDKEIA